MASASLRAYLMGPDTLQTQREIVLAYLNSMPLAAKRDWGEVHGLGDGLSVLSQIAAYDRIGHLLGKP